MAHKVTDNTASSRYELIVEGQVAFANYHRLGNTLYIDHVEAPMALRGKGVASSLMQGVLEHAIANGLEVVPICSYATAWMDKNKGSAS